MKIFTRCAIFNLVLFAGNLVTGCRVTVEDFATDNGERDLEQVTIDHFVNGPWMTGVIINGTTIGNEVNGRLCHDGAEEKSEFAIIAEMLMKAASITDCESIQADTPYMRVEEFEMDCGDLEKYVPNDGSFNFVSVNGIIRDPPLTFAPDSSDEHETVSTEVEYDAAHYLVKIELSLEPST